MVNLRTLKTSYREYGESDNPPILHRKEQFVQDGYPGPETFAALTEEEEKAGLYENPTTIGTRVPWNAMLAEKRVRIFGHRIQSIPEPETERE